MTEGVVPVTSVLYSRKARFSRSTWRLPLIPHWGPNCLTWPTLAVEEEESKYLAFLACIMEDAKEDGFANESWASQSMASAAYMLSDSFRSHQPLPP